MGLVIWVTDISSYPAASQTRCLIGPITASLADCIYERRWRTLINLTLRIYLSVFPVMRLCLVVRWWAGWFSVSGWPTNTGHHCQYFLKWPPVCSRSQHRGPVTPLFGFKTWKHKEQKATNWTKYFRSRKVFRLEIAFSNHLLRRFVQV